MGSCCSTSKGMGKKIDTLELSTLDLAAHDASPTSKNISKRWKRKKGPDQLGCKDLGHRVDIPGRLIANGGSKVACLYTQQGKKGPNQDAMLVLENFSTRNDTIFCGVFDGHGPFGHMVAKKV